MNFHDLVDRFVQPSLWLREQVWAQWALLAIVASLSFLLLALLTRRRRRAVAGAAFTDYDAEGLLSADVELADNKLSRHRIDGRRMGGGTATGRGQQSWEPTTAQAKWSDEPIRLLRREIIKRDQTEARLESELAELKAANEQLQRRLAEGEQISVNLRLKIAQLTDVNEKLRREKDPAPKQANAKDAGSGRQDQHRAAGDVDKKVCRKCKRRKARSEFHKNASSSDGLARWCKKCKTKAAKEYRKRISAERSSTQRSAICADAPLCVLHHRQADRLKRARRRRPRNAEQNGAKAHKFRSPLSSPGLHCPRK
jgi:hypothetical protein